MRISTSIFVLSVEKGQIFFFSINCGNSLFFLSYSCKSQEWKNSRHKSFIMESPYIKNSMTVTIPLLKRCTSHKYAHFYNTCRYFSQFLHCRWKSDSFMSSKADYIIFPYLNWIRDFGIKGIFVLNAMIIIMFQDWETI